MQKKTAKSSAEKSAKTDIVKEERLLDENGKPYEYVQLDEDGKPKYGAHTFEELDELNRASETVLDKLMCLFHGITYRINDSVHAIRHAYERVRYGFDFRESWSVDYALMRFLITRIELMKKNRCGVPIPYCNKARELLLARGKKSKVGTGFESSHSELELGGKLFDKDLDKLTTNARLFLYYNSCCVEDPSDFTEGFEKKYPLPKKRGGKTDYAKIDRLRVKAKYAVMDYLRDNLELLWD